MERILVLLVFVVSVAAFRPNPKFPKEETDLIKKAVSCGAHEDRRNEIISRSKCGEPKEVFVELKPQSSYMKVKPSAVWVRRCVGLCDHGPDGSKCIGINKTIEHIPVRISNLKTLKETCATYPVEVHLTCGCGCDVATRECPSPRIFNPRKCNCQCPNMKERRNCLKQRNPVMRWNPSKCICERRRR
ncbi:uncharacterized protein LOC123865964 isoform X1 [Maniola jurtina]|uniref:uncharacterized protein LOC123865964 isoform X1 n=1 Tax=Maniola jurtina TaxID=191418 RepID=UPI001E68FD79|nr:uncharacterized protein LOC123865964 isoform X1 [Maniola jurtina]